MPARQPPHQSLSLRILALLGAVLLLASACAGSSAQGARAAAEVATPAPTGTPDTPPTSVQTAEASADPTPLARPSATPTTAPAPPSNAPVFDQALLSEIVDEIDVQDGTFLFAVLDEDGAPTEASKGTSPSGESPATDDAYRIGSFTKVFTALAILTLVDDGTLALDTSAAEYVSRISVPADVTVRDLLQHTSGIYNYTDSPKVISALFEAPGVRWTPEDTVGYIAEQPSMFTPGSRFSYSNTNYLILGGLIEEVTGQLYHEAVRERITEPVGMTSTYLAGFEDGPAPFEVYEPAGVTGNEVAAFETASWAAGAMVSSPPDLHQLFNALFTNAIVSEELVAEMTQGASFPLGVSEYGLGLQLSHASRGFYGHSGGFPGYLVLIHHAPESGVTTFMSANDARFFARPAAGLSLENSRSMEMNKALSRLTSS